MSTTLPAPRAAPVPGAVPAGTLYTWLRKLGAANRIEAARRARAKGWL